MESKLKSKILHHLNEIEKIVLEGNLEPLEKNNPEVYGFEILKKINGPGEPGDGPPEEDPDEDQ